ncbi:MAG TPA: hypothetical protein VK139_03835 [Microbacteriaceae bacterium]|nr:hypothetical protein [Microbacteriaceae bacterium]
MSELLFEPATDEHAFKHLVDSVSGAVRLDGAFPRFPFRRQGYVSIIDWGCVISPILGRALEQLTNMYGDTHVEVYGRNLSTDNFRDSYGYFPGFVVATEQVNAGYQAGISKNWNPRPGFINSLDVLAQRIAVVGSSGHWALWGERRWEIGLLQTSDELDLEEFDYLPLYDRNSDFTGCLPPEGWGGYPKEIVDHFVNTVRTQGRPPRDEASLA